MYRACAIVVLFLLPLILIGAECSPVLTNPACVVTLDREAPSSPLPIKASHEAVVTIRVNKRPLDKVTFDATFTDVQTPDPLNAILAAFSPALKSVVFSSETFRGLRERHEAADDVKNQLTWIDTQQNSMQPQLDALKAQIDKAGQALKEFQATKWADWMTRKNLSAERTSLIQLLSSAGTATPPVGVVNGLHEALLEAGKAYAKLALVNPPVSLQDGNAINAKLNDVGANQAQLEASIASLQTAQAGLMTAVTALKRIDLDKALTVEQPFSAGSTSVGRTATVKVSVQDTLSNSPTALGSVSITWGTSRWEVSSGVLFSFLPNRSFQASPQIVNGQAQLDASGKTNTQITENITRPSVVPVVFLAHYRVGEKAFGDRRLAFLLSGGLGVSPYTGSADFLTGATVGYRAAMISALVHFGRDTRLTNGLYLGEPLGSSPPALSTEKYWVRKLGIAVTIRLPF